MSKLRDRSHNFLACIRRCLLDFLATQSIVCTHTNYHLVDHLLKNTLFEGRSPFYPSRRHCQHLFLIYKSLIHFTGYGTLLSPFQAYFI